MATGLAVGLRGPASASADGLRIEAGPVEVRGIAITRTARALVHGPHAAGLIVANCWLGARLSSEVEPNGTGVLLEGLGGTIGLPDGASSTADRNVIVARGDRAGVAVRLQRRLRPLDGVLEPAADRPLRRRLAHVPGASGRPRGEHRRHASRRATVRLEVKRRAQGRWRRIVLVRHRAAAGANSVALSRKATRRLLRLGRLRATAVAVDAAGRRSKRADLAFRGRRPSP